jgi:hypothetical protein
MKTGKLRGFGARNRAKLQLLLNCSEPRVDSKEAQGLFNKTATAEGYLLIWAVMSRSDGSDPI